MLFFQLSRCSFDAVRVLARLMKQMRLGEKEMRTIELDKRRVFSLTSRESRGATEVPPREGVEETGFRITAV